MEGLPRDSGGIGNPVLVRPGVATGLLAFFNHTRIGRFELRSHATQFLIGFDLEA
jgi:hypothetical protein